MQLMKSTFCFIALKNKSLLLVITLRVRIRGKSLNVPPSESMLFLIAGRSYSKGIAIQQVLTLFPVTFLYHTKI